MNHNWEYKGECMIILKGRSVGPTTMPRPPFLNAYWWRCSNCGKEISHFKIDEFEEPEISCEEEIIRSIIT